MKIRRGDEIRQILALFDSAGPGGRLFALDVAAETGFRGRAVYTLLARLELTGWLQSAWDEPERGGSARRRFYFLTGIGQDRVGDFLHPRTPRYSVEEHLKTPLHLLGNSH